MMTVIVSASEQLPEFCLCCCQQPPKPQEWTVEEILAREG